MAKQTLVFESAVELSLNGEMILISGRRVSRMTKGIYIVGGRKVAK
jgi:hypothetical protein